MLGRPAAWPSDVFVTGLIVRAPARRLLSVFGFGGGGGGEGLLGRASAVGRGDSSCRGSSLLGAGLGLRHGRHDGEARKTCPWPRACRGPGCVRAAVGPGVCL